MYVVEVGLEKVYKALIRLARGTFSDVALLMSMSEAFSVPFLTLIKLLHTHTQHKLEKRTKPKVSRRKEIIKIRD